MIFGLASPGLLFLAFGTRDEFPLRVEGCRNQHSDILETVEQSQPHSSNQSQVRAKMSLNDLEFAYAPVRDQVRDLREYL